MTSGTGDLVLVVRDSAGREVLRSAQLQVADEREKLTADFRAALGSPPAATPLYVLESTTPPTPKRWSGYRVQSWAIQQDWDGWDAGAPPPWPCFTRATPTRLTWQVWLSTAQRDGSPLVAERRWHPEHGKQDSIRHLERPHPPAQLLDADRGFQLLHMVLPVAGETLRDRVDAELRQRIRDGWTTRRPPSATAVIDWLGYERTGFLKRFTLEAGQPMGEYLAERWPELLDEAVREKR